MAKPVQPAVLPENGRGEQPDERDNEIVIELDRENQYGRTQPRANEPQGNHLRNIQMVHPHLVSRHIFFFFFFSFVRFFSSLVSITREHTHSVHLPSCFQSIAIRRHTYTCTQGAPVFSSQIFVRTFSAAATKIKMLYKYKSSGKFVGNLETKIRNIEETIQVEFFSFFFFFHVGYRDSDTDDVEIIRPCFFELADAFYRKTRASFSHRTQVFRNVRDVKCRYICDARESEIDDVTPCFIKKKKCDFPISVKRN